MSAPRARPKPVEICLPTERPSETDNELPSLAKLLRDIDDDRFTASKTNNEDTVSAENRPETERPLPTLATDLRLSVEPMVRKSNTEQVAPSLAAPHTDSACPTDTPSLTDTSLETAN